MKLLISAAKIAKRQADQEEQLLPFTCDLNGDAIDKVVGVAPSSSKKNMIVTVQYADKTIGVKGRVKFIQGSLEDAIHAYNVEQGAQDLADFKDYEVDVEKFMATAAPTRSNKGRDLVFEAI